MIENYKYYNGFEGEPEYIFCLYDDYTLIEKVHLWDGYFSDIMNAVSPAESGWTGLAEYYNLCIDWEQEKWRVPDNAKVLQQLSELDRNKIEFSESFKVLDILIEIFTKACENNFSIYIEKD